MARTAIIKLRALLLLAFIVPVLVRATDSSAASDPPEIKLPRGMSAEFWSYFVPRDNPLSAAGIELGRRLFFDKRLSADGSVSCATCHDPDLAFTDGKPVAVGIGGRRGARNSPTLLNAMFYSGQFWDGRAETLEEQAVQPLVNADEMGNDSYAQVVARLQSLSEYAPLFQEAFGGGVSIGVVGRAIASYERTLVSANSPYDRFIAGERGALTDSALRGLALFRGRARCAQCHSLNQAFPFFTDQNYRNTTVSSSAPSYEPLVNRASRLARSDASRSMLDELSRQPGAQELGRFLVTGNLLDVGSFRTPSLRNVELTAPYFHNGSAQTLADVVRFYVKGGTDHPLKDWELHPVSLTEQEQQDLIEYLKSLTSDDLRKR